MLCGATDGAAVALLSVRQMAEQGIMPNLRYQFRDRPHTTRTCIKLAYSLCSESEDLRERLITGPQSFARRAKNSRRFQQLWKQKQLDEPDAMWNVLADLGYAEQRFDSRSKPMARFLLKLGPALEVLQALSRDLNPHHKQDAKWARDLLQLLAGPAGFVKLVMFAVDTDFAVAAHKLIRLQDTVGPDVSVAAHEVQQCADVCRMLFHEGRVFDRAPNGTYTNHLLQGFYGVSRELVLSDREQKAVKFGWPAATDEGLLKEAVEYARKLYKAVNLRFQYNFPHYAWRTRFQAFCLTSQIAHTTRRSHIQALAAKEGVDPARAWQQFFEGFPHAVRCFKECGDTRQSWTSYLETYCREPRHPHGWRLRADCIVPLVLTFLGIMDGSSDIERHFSTLELLECRRAKRHHSEQFLQDLLKVRLHAPEEFRAPIAGGKLEEHAFIRAAQMQYASLFGTRRLASRSVTPVSTEEKQMLLASRRPRWQHARPLSTRTCDARAAEWESSVQRMLSEGAGGKACRTSFAGSVCGEAAEGSPMLARAEAAFAKHGAEHEVSQFEAERANRHAVIGPPPVLRLAALLDVPPCKKPKKAVPAASLELAASSGLPSSSCTTLVADAVQLEIPGTRARPLMPDAALQPPPCLESLQLAPSMQVYCSAEAVAKHPRTAAY